MVPALLAGAALTTAFAQRFTKAYLLIPVGLVVGAWVLQPRSAFVFWAAGLSLLACLSMLDPAFASRVAPLSTAKTVAAIALVVLALSAPSLAVVLPAFVLATLIDEAATVVSGKASWATVLTAAGDGAFLAAIALHGAAEGYGTLSGRASLLVGILLAITVAMKLLAASAVSAVQALGAITLASAVDVATPVVLAAAGVAFVGIVLYEVRPNRGGYFFGMAVTAIACGVVSLDGFVAPPILWIALAAHLVWVGASSRQVASWISPLSRVTLNALRTLGPLALATLSVIVLVGATDLAWTQGGVRTGSALLAFASLLAMVAARGRPIGRTHRLPAPPSSAIFVYATVALAALSLGGAVFVFVEGVKQGFL